MSNNSSTTAEGTSGLTLLGIAFVVLKLTKVIDWSWWYVTMPFWLPISIVLTFGFLYIIFLLINK